MFKQGDQVQVELKSHGRESPSFYKVGTFKGYDKNRAMVEIDTIEGRKVRSFSLDRVKGIGAQ